MNLVKVIENDDEKRGRKTMIKNKKRKRNYSKIEMEKVIIQMINKSWKKKGDK